MKHLQLRFMVLVCRALVVLLATCEWQKTETIDDLLVLSTDLMEEMDDD